MKAATGIIQYGIYGSVSISLDLNIFQLKVARQLDIQKPVASECLH